ncbi:MAG: hypothetical protein GY724_00680, partial [Actinomycetia bacterium]|nr:hypothetical protein [Actinomycetes bacterium]
MLLMGSGQLGNRSRSYAAEQAARNEATDALERARATGTVKKLLGRPLSDAEVSVELAGRAGRRQAVQAHVRARRAELAGCREERLQADTEARARLLERRKMAGAVHRLNERLFHGERLGTCGNVREPEAGIKRATAEGDRCHWTGLETCGSIHGCMTCGGKIRSHRSKDIRTVLKAALAEGLYAVMITLTVPHWAADDLAELYGHNEPGKRPARGIRAAWNVL